MARSLERFHIKNMDRSGGVSIEMGDNFDANPV